MLNDLKNGKTKIPKINLESEFFNRNSSCFLVSEPATLFMARRQVGSFGLA